MVSFSLQSELIELTEDLASDSMLKDRLSPLGFGDSPVTFGIRSPGDAYLSENFVFMSGR